ncbi:MAG TPA: hypothetical protein P5347_01755 [Smithellaceae bacterium]|nr:hypothetical protein [Smithellaceae bacterium]
MDRGRLRHSAITSGEKSSAFYSVAEKYAAILARDGVKLIVLPSAGAVENLQRLNDPMFKVDIGFVQAGLARGQNIEKLISSTNVNHS